MHQDLGLYFNRHSTLSSYLCITLMIICGMCLVKGGNVPPECILPRGIKVDERNRKIWRTPVTGRFPVVGIFPTGVLPDEILGDNDDRIRMAISSLCNPLRSYPDSQKMEEALKKLELYVAIDSSETEATAIADYVLPGMNTFESGGDFNIFTLTYPEIVYYIRRRVLEPLGEAKEEALIFAELTEALGLIPKLPQWMYKAAEEAVETGDRMRYFARIAGWLAAGRMRYFDQAATIIALTLGKAYGSAGLAMCWAGLITGPLFGKGLTRNTEKTNKKQNPILSRLPIFKELCELDAAFQKVLEHPEGAIIGYSDEEHLMQKHIQHRDKKLHMWCQEIDDYIKRVIPEKEAENLKLKDGYNMILSAGRRIEAGANASMRNSRTNQYRQPYTLAMNPEDAAERGILNGQVVRVSTERGSLEIPVEYTWQTSKGYCLIPHNFGLNFEGKTYGTHVNLLTNHQELDELTGNVRWRYIPCKVEAI